MVLNPLQERAVEFVDGPVLCLAGPGSGKTKVITLRIQHLIDTGISPSDIAVITFTKAAALEMKERFDNLSDNKYPVTFATFHSLFWSILQQEKRYKASDIVMGARRLDIVKEAIAFCGLNCDDKDLITLFSTHISVLSNKLYSYREAMFDNYNEESFRVYEAYQALKDKYRLLDFDDMLKKTYDLFINDKECLKRWQKRFSYFLIDEMQDMNDMQFELMKMLSAAYNNVFAVGDDDQSIYGFRGANPEVMKSFRDYYENCRVINLNTNYRNPSNILVAANKLISHNNNRFEKEIKFVKDAGLIEIKTLKSTKEEADFVAKRIISLSKGGLSFEDMAVLYRNHSDARFVVDTFLDLKIPFFLKEKIPNIYSHFIFDDIEAYFQIAVGNSTRKRMLRIMNRPNRYIHRQCVEQGYDFASMLYFYGGNRPMQLKIQALQRDMELMSKMSPYAAVNYILNVMGYMDFLKDQSIEENCEINEYIEITDFVLSTFRDCKTIIKAIEKLQYLRLKVDYENKSKGDDKRGKVGLYTLHSSKGLEFNTVFIVGVNEGIMPYKKAVKTADLEAERRLFYVGITRSKESLILSSVEEKNRDRMYPSRFIHELGLDEDNYSSPPKASS